MPTTINGTYKNSDFDIQVTFPDGWQAVETKSNTGDSVIAQPAHANSTQGSLSGTIIAMDMIPVVPTVPPPNPNIPKDPQVKCNTISSNNTNFQSWGTVITVLQCNGPNVDMKMKSYSIQKGGSIIFVSYIATPSNLYDSNIATFDTFIKSIQFTQKMVTQSLPKTTPPAVPEFPASTGIIMAMIIGLAILITRTRISWNLRNSSM